MLVSLMTKNKINDLVLPVNCYGVYWVNDMVDNEQKILASIEAIDGKWYLKGTTNIVILDNNVEREQIELEKYKFYYLYDKNLKRNNILYCSPSLDTTNASYYMLKDNIVMGCTDDADIKINNSRFFNSPVQISFNDSKFSIVPNNNTNIYVNNIKILSPTNLKSGDTIFVNGIKIILVCEENKALITINNPAGIVSMNNNSFNKIIISKSSLELDDKLLEDEKLYSDDDYFHKKPRFKENIKTLDLSIDAPPTKQQKTDMPAILIIGPMVTSSAITLIYGYMTVQNLMISGRSFSSAWPSLIVCIFSLMATLGWPFIIRTYTKRKEKKAEKYRTEKYNIYLNNILNTINEEAGIQKRIILENNPSVSDCMEAIERKNVSFWNRKIGDEDFLNVNIGIGNIPMFTNIRIPEMHFQLENDELLEKISKINTELPMLQDVPIVYNFLSKKVIATIGEYDLNKKFVDQILFQVMALHSYDDVKIVVLTDDEKDNNRWDYIKILPHAWTNDKSMHFYGTNKDEIREICYYLDNVFAQRSLADTKKSSDYPFYLIVTDNYKVVRNFEFIKKLLESEKNYGFSLLILNDKVYNLPAMCDNFINVNSNTSEIFQNILNSQVQKFKIDFQTEVDMYKYAKILANTPVELTDKDDDSLATKIGFLELYNVGKIEQLNILNRWKESNPIISLQSLIGLGKGGEKIYLDLHEKYHGPHGLIAGMTGSGKSEFLATYMLSLAINYSPNDVQFILIDYKGGGLAGAFENKETGVKLPHLIGTITNLDENEIKRSLASIESELTRRQLIFKQVREKLGDSVVDIYKYQQLYRDGLIDEPISHLFIICDEFAELKSQQPEFLQQLISISRIGRSLGIHLILATQKPSGIVDNQIWSNSKFRVCLRVQEKSDSMEVIKSPDAAFLKNVGRFYLQVGYNEVFISGQAAWAGGKYIPSDKVKTKNDYSVEFINNIGYVVKKVDTIKNNETNVNYGEEIKNIVFTLDQLAKDEGIVTNNLWLEKMPPYININELKRKYNFIKEPFVLNVPIGEFDVPYRQRQELLTVPFYKDGNVIVYGSQGSGKENFLTTMIYSSITSFSTKEVIYYILDFESGSLKIFDGIPHIGDVIVLGENEKVQNLYKMLSSMLMARKNLFADYGGNYEMFCHKSTEKVPSVIVVISNYDSYIENYSQMDDLLIQLTRDGQNYGMYFVLTVSNPNNVRSRLRQNFRCEFVLQQNNVSDYSNILGNVNKMYPSKIFGRGIVKFDDVYEFQTAMVSERENIFNYINQVKSIINENSSLRAIEVPTLPRVVTYRDVAPAVTQDGKVAIGIDKDSMEIIKYDLKRNFVNLFTTFDIELYNKFLPPLIKQIEQTNCFETIIFNCEGLNISSDHSPIYVNNFDSIFEKFLEYVESKHHIYLENNYNKDSISTVTNKLCIIIGFDSFKNKLSPANSSKVVNLFEKAKDLGIINFIIIDTVEKIRKYEFDSWYKTVVNNTKGIFLGNGISEQMTIKITRNDRSLRNDVPNNFCYVINRGKPSLVKYIEDFDNDF